MDMIFARLVDEELAHSSALFELDRADIAQSGVPLLPVIANLDIFKSAQPGNGATDNARRRNSLWPRSLEMHHSQRRADHTRHALGNDGPVALQGVSFKAY